jgi:hypothetical protein
VKRVAMVIAVLSFIMVSVVSAVDVTPEQQLANLQAEKALLDAKMAAAEKATQSKFTGLGEEIGGTLDGAAEVTIERVGEFSETRVGKFSMFLIAWQYVIKDLGAGAWNNVIGLIFLFVCIHMLNTGRRTLLTGQMVCVEKTGKEKKYERREPLHKTDISSEAYFGWCAIYVGSCLAFFIAAVVCFSN